MQIRDYFWTHIEEFYDGIPGWDGEALQVSRGHLNCGVRMVDLGEIRLTWSRYQTRLLVHEVSLRDALILGLGLEGAPGPMFGADQLRLGQVVLWRRGHELAYTIPAGHASLIVEIRHALAEELGWYPQGTASVLTAPSSTARQLISACHLATTWVDRHRMTPELVDPRAATAQLLGALDAFFAGLDKASIEGAPPGRASRHASLVRAARRQLKDRSECGEEQIAALAGRLGVSPRTLFRAFRDATDLTPLNYRRLSRLHALRRALLSASPRDASVTQLATDLGFNHLGRLAGEYKRHFQELPRDTLSRATR